MASELIPWPCLPLELLIHSSLEPLSWGPWVTSQLWHWAFVVVWGEHQREEGWLLWVAKKDGRWRHALWTLFKQEQSRLFSWSLWAGRVCVRECVRGLYVCTRAHMCTKGRMCLCLCVYFKSVVSGMIFIPDKFPPYVGSYLVSLKFWNFKHNLR